MRCEVTILCLVRHGHATARVCLESLYAATTEPIRVIYADIGSPPSVARYLADFAAATPGFTHLRFDELISRQQARLAAMKLVETPLVALLDNNMTVSTGWLDALRRAQAETGAAIVSPIIVSRGGRVHFSGARVIEKRRFFKKRIHRPQEQEGVPIKSMLAHTRPKRVDIDFAESHCCLAHTADLRLPGILEERMHNAHTICYGSFQLRSRFGKRLVLEPTAVASIVPIGFGYDLPWIGLEYLEPERLRGSYRMIEELFGVGPGTDAAMAFAWHAKHLKYLLLTMLDEHRLERDDLLSSEELPDFVDGYDVDLPSNADQLIRDHVLPFVERNSRDLKAPLMQWLGRKLPL